ncbi:MAG TPA: LptA/OstA family protein [Candidatus Acidoferrum sp.]|nr:LptA/OstA family protein [Candidatus Acidoferrum sp.]
MCRNRHLHLLLCSAVVAVGLCVSDASLALPEDAKQAIDIDGPAGSSAQADGWVIYKGSVASPAKLTQGTLLITGAEIRILTKDKELQLAIATGAPAHFQQQPSKDQALVTGNGKQISLNNNTNILTIDGDGELNQDGKLIQSPHIEHKMNTTESSTGPVHMTIPPKKDKP